MRSEPSTTVHLPDVIVVSLAAQIVQHPEAAGELRATDGSTIIHVELKAGRITVTTLEGPEKGHPPRDFSVLRLTTEQVYWLGKAYRAWLEAQATKFGLPEPVWE